MEVVTSNVKLYSKPSPVYGFDIVGGRDRFQTDVTTEVFLFCT